MTVGERSAEPLFICAGRLVPHKRIDLLLRVWDHVRPVVGGTLVVMGDGPDRASLRLSPATVSYSLVEWTKMRSGACWVLHGLSSTLRIMKGGESSSSRPDQLALPALGFTVPGVRDAIVDGQDGNTG